ncbi:MAG: 2OG-Fe(II) oxygenase family protein [Pseudomonadota bacterium]
MNEHHIQTVDYHAADAGQAFTHSIADSGFALLQNHPLAADRLKRIYADWLAFFASDEKFDYAQSDRDPNGDQHGYFSLAVSEKAVGHDVKDIKEFFHAGPDGRMPDALRGDIMAYRACALTLARELLGWLDTYIPTDVRNNTTLDLGASLADAESLLRILHYPPLSGDEPAGSVRAAAHEDINFITLLPVADAPGLQVLSKSGDWLDLDGREGDLIVNTGDMLRELTNGYVKSTTHRVINPTDAAANRSRISIPFFLTPALDSRLSSRYTAGEYLAERIEAIDGSR